MQPVKFLTTLGLLLLAAALTLGSVSPALAQSSAAVRVDPASASLQVNAQSDFFVRAENVVGLTAFEIHLSFNPAVVEVVEISNGGFVAADFTVQNTFDNASGTIDYAIAQLNRTPAQGGGALLRIRLRAKANGSSALSLRGVQAAPTGLLLSDANGSAIAAAWTGGSVTVGGQTSVPPTATPSPTTAGPTSTSTLPGPTITPSATLTPSPTPVATVAPPANLGTHTVRWGESLYCIGRAYGVYPWSIAEKNGIWWPYWVFPGQVLTIPNVAWPNIPTGPVCSRQFSPTAAPPTLTPTPTATSGGPILTPTPTSVVACRAYHVVRSGDTLYRIGLTYGVPYMDIARANNLANPRLIYAGQRLCIP